MALSINGEEIDDEVIEAEFRQVKGHYERTLQVSCCERDPEFLATAKDNLTTRVLLNQEAKKRVPDVTDEAIEERLKRLIDEAGGEDQFYMNIGMPYKDEAVVRDNVAGGVRLDQMLKDVYSPEPEPSEDEIRSYYDEHIDQYLSQEEIRASHITKSLQGASSRAEVYAEMREIRTQLLDGADFDELAEKHRSDEQQQIDLGWFKRGEFMEEFETIAFSMNKEEISPVFMTQLGFHVCVVTDRRPPAPLPFDEVRDNVRQRIIDDHRDAKFNLFTEELKTGADIVDKDPESDCGCY
jgi:parvulin-like peptidyl-prolyl isomerase